MLWNLVTRGENRKEKIAYIDNFCGGDVVMDWEEKGINFIRVDDSVWHVTDLARARVADNRLDGKLKKYHVAILYTIINLGGIADTDEVSSETGIGLEKVAGALAKLDSLGYVKEIASGRLLSDRDKNILYGTKTVSPTKELTLERQNNVAVSVSANNITESPMKISNKLEMSSANSAPNFVNNSDIPGKVNERIEMAKTYGG